MNKTIDIPLPVRSEQAIGPVADAAPLPPQARAAGSAHRALRTALGQFATGIAVVTAIDRSAGPIGITVNSFVSASLEPPLVTWSLAMRSKLRGAFAGATHHAINVLASTQAALASRFAAPLADRFAGVRFRCGPWGVPLLGEALAHLIVARRRVLHTGDHVTFVGEVIHFHSRPGEPLVFHRGAYWTTSPCGIVPPRAA
jgi:flavin reductase (DIM6/NTAB) family NADH-FMN oxidoreductase RutF